jgi:tetratricopeptide (TPR) repeat protein
MNAVEDDAMSSSPAPDPLRRSGPLRNVLDRLFGYDYFISYSHGDGTEYPSKLARRLEQTGFRVFLDSSEYHVGDDLVAGTRRRVRMSAYFVLVAGPQSLRSVWVLRELQSYVGAGRPPIVININRALESADANPEILQLVENRIYVSESLEAGEHQPTDRVLAEIRRSFNSTRQETRRIRYLAAATVAFAALAFAATVLAGASVWYAREARWETDIAKGQTNLALSEGARARRLLVASYAEAAQVAMRRGDWKAAEGGLQKALDAGHPDRNGLLLEMVKVKSALYEVAQAEEILRSLAGSPDLTAESRGMLLLWRGDLELSKSFAYSEDALKLVRQATEAKLPEAELAYAKGLIAATTDEAVKSLEFAVEKDPFHPRANAILALFYLHLGRFGDARDRLVFAEKVFPHNPTYKVIQATACALEGKQADAERLMEAARPGLSEDQHVATRAVVELYRDMSLVDLADELDPDAPLSRQLAPYLKMFRMATQLQNLSTNQDVRFFPLPPLIMSVQSRALRLMPRLNLRILLGGDPQRELEELSELAVAMPDGYFHLLRGMLLFSRDRFADAVAAFDSAAVHPSMLKVRQPALYLKAMSAFLLGARSSGPERKAAFAKAVQAVREVESLSDDFPAAEAENITRFLIDVRELDLARRIIEKWERRTPTDPRLLRKKATVELESGSFGRAIALSKMILTRNPSDAETKRVLASAESQLADLFQSATAKPLK